MVSDQTVRIEELPSWWRALFRPRQNDRVTSGSIIPGPIDPDRFRVHTRVAKTAKMYGKKLEKIEEYVAERDRYRVRPLRHLVTSKYAGKSGLGLMGLPVTAISGMNAALAAKLAKIKIVTVDDLAKSSLKKLKATKRPQEELARARSYARDIVKHATVQRIIEHRLPLEEMIKPKFAKIPIRGLPNLRLDAMKGIAESTARKVELAGLAIRIGDLHGVSREALMNAGVSSHRAFLMKDYSAMIVEYAVESLPPLKERPALGTLRVLTFDGVLELEQSIRPEDRTAFEPPEYPLDNPNKKRTPSEILGEPYVGYIIAADKIVIKEDLTTNGNDLVLVAKTIQVGKMGAITINTKPRDFDDVATDQTDGLNADNGGDLVFLCQQYTVLPGCTFHTTGGKGQDGGQGRPMTKQDPLVEDIDFDKPSRSGSVWGTFFGMLGDGYCRFHVDPGEWLGTWTWRVLSYEFYHYGTTGDPVNVTGTWTLWNSIVDAAPRYVTLVDIPDIRYPTAGRPGGYGGNPGKISLIIPDLSGITGIDGLQILAETGVDGAPGEGGKGGDYTPDLIIRASLPIPTPDYLEEYTIGKAEHTWRGEPEEPYVGGYDRFHRLVGERLDSGSTTDKLEDSLCGATFGADLLILYAPNLDCKRTGAMKEALVWGGCPWPISIWLSATAYGVDVGTFLTKYRVDNNIAIPRPSSMQIILDDCPRGKPKTSLPTETESLATLSKSWYEAVYEVLPEYPLKQYKQADAAFRRGDSDLAAELYSVVLSFAEEVPDFQSDHATIVSDAEYRLDLISKGYDYFGFTVDTIIPTSPTRDYFPLPLTTAYSDTVEFYRAAIRGTHDSIETIEIGKDIIRQFRMNHSLTIDDIQESVAILEIEMAILESETDAMVSEINALLWANQRLSGLLQLWAQRVDDEIKELEKEKENQGSGWWNALIAVWNVIKLVASLFAVCAGFVEAVVATVDAMQKLGELGGHINDLRIACEELVSNLDDWSWEQINEYLDSMGGVAKEIEAWYKQAEQAWKEFNSKLQEVESTFAGTRTKLDQLTAVDMTESEATEFQENVLLADEIGVSGAMDYLMIQEQIYLNNDMLDAKYSSLEALTKSRVKLAYQALSMARELAAHKGEARYLDELLDVYTSWNTEQKQNALEHLVNIGQHSLDSLMHRLARQTRQLKFLNLDKDLSPGNYAYFIDQEGDVGTVLRAKDELLRMMTDWIDENSNIGRLKVVITKDPDYAANLGGITIVDPTALTKFSLGQYLRPSRIVDIEPLRETVFVARLAQGITNRRSDPGELARLLISQFLVRDGGAYQLIEPHALGFDVPRQVVCTILSRERLHHPLLDAFPDGPLDDTTIVLAYALARGGVTLSQLTDVLQQTSNPIPAPLESRLETIQSHWVTLSNEVISEQAKSLRSLIKAVQDAAGNPAELRAVLDEALIADGQFVWLGRFHLDHQDIQEEIANSYDPDPSMQEAVLARVYSGEPMHVVAAVVLLYSGLDGTQLGSLAQEYTATPNLLGDCIANVLKAQWNILQSSVLEKRHDIQIHITPGDYLAIPNSAEMFRETRYLAARAKIPSGIDLVLEKLPKDMYLRELADGTLVSIEFQFENADDLVSQAPLATPLGLNVADVHLCDLFGRSILGKWRLSFTYKGNRPALPSLDLIELEFLHTYAE